MSQLWEELLDKLEEIAYKNSAIADEIKKIADNTESESEFAMKAEEMFAINFPQIHKKYSLGNIKLAAPKDFNLLKNPKLKNFIKNRMQNMEALADFNSGALNQSMQLSDLFKNGPTNAEESILLEAAKTLLEPHEFAELVLSKSTLISVMKKIQESTIKKLHFQLFVIYHIELMKSGALEGNAFLNKMAGALNISPEADKIKFSEVIKPKTNERYSIER